MYLIKLDGSKQERGEERGGAHGGDNRSDPAFGNKGGKDKKRNQVCKRKGKGGREMRTY